MIIKTHINIYLLTPILLILVKMSDSWKCFKLVKAVKDFDQLVFNFSSNKSLVFNFSSNFSLSVLEKAVRLGENISKMPGIDSLLSQSVKIELININIFF